MKQIGMATRAAASRTSLPVSATATQMPSALLGSNLPPVRNQITDIDIPNSAWARWIENGKPRQLRRELSSMETVMLLDRRAELERMVAPYSPRELDAVSLALGDMYGGFTSMANMSDQQAAVRLDGALRVLSDFPAWAIQKACLSIQMNGVWREGKFDRRWPPNDSEIVDATRQEARLYSDQHKSATDLLAAEVEST